ncbi:type I-E CRISPR-associated protein Cas7/Cse4/CasC [Geotalea uraniireducens]|uniref:CRISPR-associated protein, Cse4 family n=1 Tax=Geotalea uraniireducens (strain Rf4) TaxID=351605 RepID=A5GBK1_GEOUR|nr:type I-E CRISPR-associated protein Cas7/Cse4/CasC [Geotalea uraniireducens]ABQ25038.1 CRISPR-associated protein, Cse4 family [Geotalea uraniireducens Rf4]
MKHLELHIIQSVPVACLNRDDLNSPKTAVFGGVQRARVSSQSWKRAIREMAKEIAAEEKSDLFSGDRTRRMVYTLSTRLAEKGITSQAAIAIAEQVADVVETLDSKVDSEGYKKIKTVMFFSKAEYDAIAEAIATSDEVKNSVEALEKAAVEGNDREREKALKAMVKILEKGAISKTIKSAQLKDAADIALFGRMVANDPSLKVDGASMFAHILSTHKADNEIDFFAAVDDLNKDESGAGMTSTLEFNSATYYRFAALNLDALANDDHLGDITLKDGTVVRSVETRKQVVKTFLKAIIQSIPSARKTTMNGNTLPVYVLGVVREKGHPIQLINAFETPVRRSEKGFVTESINRMNIEYADLKETWGVDSLFAKAVVKGSLKEQIKANQGSIETCSQDDLINGMVAHVI